MSCPFRKISHPSIPSLWNRVKAIFFPDQIGNLDSYKDLFPIFNTIFDSIIIIDEHGTILFANQTTEKMFGYTQEELLGHNVKILQPEPFRSQHDSYLKNYLTTGEKKIIGIGREVVGQKKNGSTIRIDLAVTEHFIKNKRFFTGTIRDVTDKKTLEDLRIENVRMEALNTAKNEFITVMSHELRTPLHAIMGFTECLLNGLDGPVNPEQLKSLQRIDHAGRHLLGLVNGVLELSKISANPKKIVMEPCNFIEILENCLQIVLPLAEKKELKLEKSIQKSPCTITGNPESLREICLNLLGNAIRFTESGKIVVTFSCDEKQLTLSITDTGIGLNEQDLSKLFIPFALVSLKRNGEENSFGIGLAISKKLVEAHGGTITVTSKKGEGSCFTVQLPLQQTNLTHPGKEHGS